MGYNPLIGDHKKKSPEVEVDGIGIYETKSYQMLSAIMSHHVNHGYESRPTCQSFRDDRLYFFTR